MGIGAMHDGGLYDHSIELSRTVSVDLIGGASDMHA